MSARRSSRLNPDPPEVAPWQPSPKKRRTMRVEVAADGDPVDPQAPVVIPPAPPAIPPGPGVVPQAAVVPAPPAIPPGPGVVPQTAVVTPPVAAVAVPAADVVQQPLALEMAGISTSLLSDFIKQVKVSQALKKVVSGLEQKVDVYRAQQNNAEMKSQTLQDQLLALNELTVITGEDFEALALLKNAGYDGKINFA